MTGEQAPDVPQPDPELEQVRLRLSSVQRRAQRPVSDPQTQDAENRGWIARWIIIAFLAAIIIVIGFIIYGVNENGVLLPVVTLILGYYFGQSSKSGN
jgi:fatty acid desaturase